MRWYLTLTLLVWVSAAAPADERWLEARSPHFTVLTDVDEGSARRITVEFELIRSVFRQALGGAGVDPAQPIIIYALGNESGMAELLSHVWADPQRAKPAGLFLSGPDKHYVALRLDGNRERPFATIYHEYFHVLAAVNLARFLPGSTRV